MADKEEKRDEVTQQGTHTSTSTNDVGDSNNLPADKEWLPIRAQDSHTHAPRSRSNSRPTSLRSMSRARSQNGFGCDDPENDSDNTGDSEAQAEKDPFEVGWDDGDNDPLNPRSKSMVVKWLIVIICSLSSLCV